MTTDWIGISYLRDERDWSKLDGFTVNPWLAHTIKDITICHQLQSNWMQSNFPIKILQVWIHFFSDESGESIYKISSIISG